jgi:hypothetical protein
MPGLADSLALVTPALPPALVRAERIPVLSALAEQLAPIHRAGFECRLQAGDSQVDFQQGIPSTDGEPERLAAFLDRQDLPAAWHPVVRFVKRWATPGDVVHTAVSELWLEFDLAAAAPAGSAPPPSVFTVIRPTEDGSRGVRAVVEALLGEEEAGPLAAVVDRLVRECRHGSRVSHLGAMLGRRPSALRVHVNDIPLGDLRGYLDRIEWPGDAAEVEALGRMLLDHTDVLVLCLDVLADLTPRAGLECFFAQRHGLDPRWRPLLGHLAELGWCAPEKADALVRWPGRITPLDQGVVWPENLILQSIPRPPDVLGIVERRLSHVKLTSTPGAPVTAKAYFGFGHLWLNAPRGSSPPAPQAVRPAASVEVAVGAAVGWLLGMRNQAGWWRDFFDRARPRDADRRVTGYASDEWVTAYVASALAPIGKPEPEEAAREGLALLLARRADLAGWGYHALLPADADTTTWVLRLARSLADPSSERLAAGRRLVEELTRPDGGVATYRPQDAAALAEFLRMDGSYSGWCAPHTCVTAAAALLGLDEAMTAYLVREQRLDGSWAGHWWDDDEYATARAVEALSESAAGAEPVDRALAWCAGRVAPDGAVYSKAHGGPSPFATALVLSALRAGGAWPIAAERAERWLLDHQLEDGSWEPSARLRVPAPSALDPRETPELTLTYLDDEATFTTATVLMALAVAPL